MYIYIYIMYGIYDIYLSRPPGRCSAAPPWSLERAPGGLRSRRGGCDRFGAQRKALHPRCAAAGDGWRRLGAGKGQNPWGKWGKHGENMGKMGFQCGFDEESHWVNRVKNAIFNQFGMVGKTWRVCALKRCFGVSVIYNPLFTPVRSSQVATPAKTSLLSNAQTVEIGGLSSCLKITGTDLPMVQNINDHHTGSNRYMVLTGKTIT